MLDIDLLRTFVAILETGSFTAASDVVRRTQSALSLQMKKLEEQVGHPLLKREPGGIKATAEGERLLIHAKRILRAHEDAILDFSEVSGSAGNLRLGISADYGQALMPRVLGVLARSYPKLSIEVVCGPSRDLREMCTDGRLEIAFVGEGEGLGQSPVLHRERLVWATGGDAHDRDPLPLALVPAEDSNYRRWALEALARVGRRHWIAYTSYSLAGLQAIVRAGCAVSVMAESALTTGIRELIDTEKFPPLPVLEVRVTRCIAKDSVFLRNLEASLIKQLSQDMGSRSADS